MHDPTSGNANSPISKSSLLEMWARVAVQLVHVWVGVRPGSSVRTPERWVPTAMPHPVSPPARLGWSRGEGAVRLRK